MFFRISQPVFDKQEMQPNFFSSTQSFPAVDVVENEKGFELIAEIPGMKREDVQISLEDRVLTLSGERKHYGLSEGTKVLRHETVTSPFRRSFELPEEVEAGSVTAELTDGVLHILLPKMEKAQPRTIAIQ